MTPERQRQMIRAAQSRAHLGGDDLWMRYFALGGTVGPVELDAFLNGALDLPADQRDHVALAVNEYLDDLVGDNRAPYSRTIRTLEAEEGALGALTSLLQGGHLAPPEAVPGAVDEAAGRLGVRAVVYLADDDRQTLVPLPGAHGRERPALRVDSTLAGLAYRTLRTQTTVSDDDQARLWVPILAGVERLGVLDVMVDGEPDLRDPELHRQCWWLTHHLGELLLALDRYGDGLAAVRRARPRGLGAELVGAMLPPGTAGTHRVVVSALLEPGSEGADDAAGSGHDDRGGDAFDYALSATRAQVALLDAGAGRLQGPLAAATSLAAYRTARRRDASLVQQAEAIQRALTARFEPGAHAGGVLADLDAASGRLRYVAAGRVSALLVRAGAVAKHLDGGRGPRLGLGAGATAVGAEQLEPGDTVVLCTDGVTEVRDDQQRQLGPDRLADALHRAFAESLPLPEVVRRVVDAVVAHRRGPLQEDATVVALQWTTLGQASLGPRLLAAAGRP